MPFNSTQGEEKPLAHLLIREALRNEVEDFQLALAQGLDQGLGRRLGGLPFSSLLSSERARTATSSGVMLSKAPTFEGYIL